MNLDQAMRVDYAAIIFSLILLFSIRRDLRLSHPAVIYMAFHLTVVSYRVHQISNSSATMYELSKPEIVRALVIADLMLFILISGWAWSYLVGNRLKNLQNSKGERSLSYPVGIKQVLPVSIIMLPYGLYAFAKGIYLPGSGVENKIFDSSYQTFAIAWPGLILAAFIYARGFKWYLISPMFVYLFIMALQGQSRYRLLLPSLLLMFIWLDQHRRKIPPIWMASLAILMVALFLPLKSIGQDARRGTLTIESTISTVKDSIQGVETGDNTELLLFDQYAAAISSADSHASFLGKPYIQMLTLPIPRVLWPDKPKLSDSIASLSTNARPIGKNGSIVTIVGDIYMNFRILGVILLGLLFARITGFFYRQAYLAGFPDVRHFTFLYFAAILIQVYRDGLPSIYTFLLVNSTPLVLISLYTYFSLRSKSNSLIPYGANNE